MASNSDLDATISALQGGLTSVSPSAAASVVENWISTLKSAGLTEIAATLTRLHTELTSGHLTGAKIGPILTELGTQTEHAAAGAEAGAAGKLTQLASLLTKAGGSIM